MDYAVAFWRDAVVLGFFQETIRSESASYENSEQSYDDCQTVKNVFHIDFYLFA